MFWKELLLECMTTSDKFYEVVISTILKKKPCSVVDHLGQYVVAFRRAPCSRIARVQMGQAQQITVPVAGLLEPQDAASSSIVPPPQTQPLVAVQRRPHARPGLHSPVRSFCSACSPRTTSYTVHIPPPARSCSR
jgi:hypothetical protein